MAVPPLTGLPDISGRGLRRHELGDRRDKLVEGRHLEDELVLDLDIEVLLDARHDADEVDRIDRLQLAQILRDKRHRRDLQNIADDLANTSLDITFYLTLP